MTSPPADTAERVPLDQVMLAMDVVDTLRHQQQLVDRELDEDRRQRDLVARVQSIYASQGIEVSADVIAEGVEALRQDRFTYRPPERTLAVRLAGLYVERGKWARRLALTALLAVLVYAAFALPAHFQRLGRIDGYARRLAATVQRSADLQQHAEVLATTLRNARRADDAPTTTQLLERAAAALQSARDRVDGVQAELSPPPDAQQYPDLQPQYDRRLASQDERLAQANADLGGVDGLIAGVQQLRSLKVRLAASRQRLDHIAMSAAERSQLAALEQEAQAAIDRGSQAAVAALRQLDLAIDRIVQVHQQLAAQAAALQSLQGALDGVDVEAGAAAELAQLRSAAAQALSTGDLDRATEQVALLRLLTRTLDQNYELRIASGPNLQSGVWRESIDHPGTRNYYIIVEPIGRDGRPVQLQITSEEDHVTRSVRRFGVRVPQSVYEAVKADKLDNGIIDDNVFGQKRRGRRAPEYRMQTAGGMITEW